LERIFKDPEMIDHYSDTNLAGERTMTYEQGTKRERERERERESEREREREKKYIK
jgi:predicted nuclease with RNAse H fold